MSTEPLYQVTYYDNLRPGFTKDQVIENLKHSLKLADNTIESLFANPRTIIKRNLSRVAARQYEQTFFKHGLIVKLESMSSDTPVHSAPLEVLTPEPVKQEPVQTANTMDTELMDGEYPNVLAFEFTGNGREYFKIWIVNILLTVITLGIYSAWAKVRNNQYFYGNTFLDDSSFEYTAKPLQILKGRILAVLVVALYFGLSHLLPPDMQPIFIGIAIIFYVVVFPWVIVQGLKFNARHSTYRNISFGFDGTYGGAFKAFILWPIASITVFLVPYVWHRQHRFFINHSRYGSESFEFSASSGDYFRIFGILVGLGLGVGVAVLILSGLFGLLGLGVVAGVVAALAYLIGYFAIGSYYACSTNNLMYSSTSLKSHSLSSEYELVSYMKLFASNTIFILLTLGLFTPWAMVRSARYHAEKTSFVAGEDLNSFVAGEEQKVNSLAEGLADSHDLFDIDVGV